MKLLHTADTHCCPEHEAEVNISLSEELDIARREKVDLIVKAGDWWDATMQNTERSGFDGFLGKLSDLGDVAPVVMVEGTPSHDIDGSLAVIKRLKSKFGITILDPGVPYFLSGTNGRVSQDQTDAILLILGIPEPRKKYLLANGTAGKDATDEAVRNAMHLLCFQFAAIRAQYKDLPCLVVYHGDVAGTTLQNDQTVERGTGIAITIDDLASIGADYVALGHIHKPQQVRTLPAYYAGSVYAKNFGEAHKPGCNLVTIDPVTATETEEEFDLFKASGAPSTGFLAKVTRIDFSHPQKYHDTVTLEEFDNTNWPVRVSGKLAWITIKDCPEAIIDLNAEHMSKEVLIRDYGALPGSYINLEKLPIETVRAAEIMETVSPEKKLEIWAEQSNIVLTDSINMKLKELLDSIELSHGSAYGEWELLWVRCRGLIGIYCGIGKEEIYVDFRKFDPGIIALLGKCGKGKSTLIENCHAYPEMFTKPGKLKDQFYLRDSFREVVYLNHVDGNMKKFLIQVNGAIESGSPEYFIYDMPKGTDKWIAMSGIDKNLKPYSKVVNETFGPVELFLRTAFSIQKAQKSFPDITDASEGEKKALIGNLTGSDHHQLVSDAAKTRADGKESEIHDSEIKIGMLENAITMKDGVVLSISALENAQATFSSQLEAVKTSGTAAKNRVDNLQTAANAERARAQRAVDAELSLGRIRKELSEINGSISSLADLSVRRPEIEKEIARYEGLKATIDTETEKLRAVEKRNQAKTDDYRAQMDGFNAKKGEIEKKIAAAKDELREKERTLEAGNQAKQAGYQKEIDAYNERMNAVSERNLQTQAKYQKELNSFNERKRALEQEVSQARIALQKSQSDAEKILSSIKLAERDTVVFDEKCLVCKAVPAEKIDSITRKREESIQRIETMQIEYADQNNAVALAEARLNELEADLASFDESKPTIPELETFNEKRPDPPKPESVPENDPINALLEALNLELAGFGYGEPQKPAAEPFDDTILSSERAQAGVIRIDELRASFTRAAEASARIEGYKAQIVEKNRQIVEKQGELDELVRNANPDAIIDLDLAKKELNELIERHRQLTADIASSEASIDAQRKRLAEIEASETELKTHRESIVVAKKEIAEWELLKKAFGPDGIQALELDALAPGIADDTNRRLRAAYGDRFTIEFKTTSISGKGSKTKQIEDFKILVTDNEKGVTSELSSKSGGESTWIVRALYDSFTAIRAKNAGIKFLTRFQDEAEGKLDVESRACYCRMLEADHAEGNYRHTIIITHSEEVKAMIEAKIDMESFAEEKAEDGKTEEAEFALEAAV